MTLCYVYTGKKPYAKKKIMQKAKDAQVAIYPNYKVHPKGRYNNVRIWVKHVHDKQFYGFYYEYLNTFRHSPVALLVTHPLEI